jgi:hypothetical protein
MDVKYFFQTVTGDTPYPCQVRCASDDTLLDVVDVPTGMGKTATAEIGSPAVVLAADRRVSIKANRS